MSDIVDRLREAAEEVWDISPGILTGAADEIERLRAEVRLAVALKDQERAELAAERALADRLAQAVRSWNPKELGGGADVSALAAWRQARSK